MAGPVTAPEARAGRALRAKEWQVVYNGPGVKCCTITFASVTDPLKEHGEPTLAIYIDGDQETNLAKSLAVGESTEVCGKTIRVYGLLRGGQVARWETPDGQPTDWFE
jgi:hypothetical protein